LTEPKNNQSGGLVGPRTDPFRWIILSGCWSLYFVFGLSIAGLAPLVSTIQSDLQLSASAMGTILGAWQFIYIFVAIPVGLALQRFGPARLLLLAGILIAASGFLRSTAQDYQVLLFAVALFGFGGPIISAGVPQTISLWFKGKERGFAMGIYITGPALAGVIAYASTQSVLMPWLDHNWRLVLQIWAWAAVVVTLVWLGITVAASNVRAQVGRPAKISAPNWQEPGLVLGLLRQRNVLMLLMIGVGVLTVDHGLRNWIPEILRTSGWSVEAAGNLAVIPVVFGIASALTFPRLAIRARRLLIMKTLFALAGTGCLLISTAQTQAVLTGLVLTGLASGALMTITILSLIEQNSVGQENAGLAGGMFFSVAEIGGVGGPVMIGLVRDYTGGFQLALWLLAGLAVLMIILTSTIMSDSATGGNS